MKLEVGMYCRTEDGYIFKYSKENNIHYNKMNNTYYLLIDNGEYDDCYTIKNFDNSIISLIEVGDYVNGYKVLFIDYDLGIKELKHKNIKCINNTEDRKSFCNEDIKTILTKEQFENNCFWIGDK